MMAHAMLRSLAAAGHRVDVSLSRACPQATEPYEIEGVHVHPRRGKGDAFRWISGPDRADVIVTHLENSERALILGKMHQLPVVVIAHNNHRETVDAIRQLPELVVYNTEWMREDVVRQLARLKPGRPVPHSITVRPPVIAEEYRVKPGTAVTLINLCRDKGSETFYRLAERFPDRPFLGVTGGYGKQDVRDLSNVEIIEHVPGHEMPERVYARTKVLLVPSAYESYGRVAIEAASSGIPVIAHPTPGLREALGDAGQFADRADIDAWTERLRRLLTPKGWSNASKAVAARAQELDPTAELAEWVSAVEGVARRGAIRGIR
jgi:glycosyltransferase involved in cell wall biosynthesis